MVDDQQRRGAAAVRGPDHVESGHGRLRSSSRSRSSGVSGDQATGADGLGQAPGIGQRHDGRRSPRQTSRTRTSTGFASFSSGGPRTGDSCLKPDITAPGVSIFSTAGGTGNGAYDPLRDLDGLAARRRCCGARRARRIRTWSVRGHQGGHRQHGGLRRSRRAPPPRSASSRGGTGIDPARQVHDDQCHRVLQRRLGVRRGPELRIRGAARTTSRSRRRSSSRTTGRPTATFSVAQALPQGSPHSIVSSTRRRSPCRRTRPLWSRSH